MIHKTALIDEGVKIGRGVKIEPFSIIHKGVNIGDHSHIGPYSELGIDNSKASNSELIIGKYAKILGRANLYLGSRIGDNLMIGHDVTIRENSKIGEGVQFGNRSDIQGDLEVGDFTKTHADVHIGKMTKIGRFCWIFPSCLFTNDPNPPSNNLVGSIIEDFVVIMSGTIILPGVTIKKNAVIGACSKVGSDIEEGKFAQGNPAKTFFNASELPLIGDINKKAYPWQERFSRGYPESILKKWRSQEE